MFLTDREIHELVRTGAVLNAAPQLADPFGPTSQIQPSSFDLGIGSIFLPNAAPGKPGSARSPKKEHTLGPGETVIVETRETLKLPPNVAAFGFPPSHVSMNGILMTNPGHVDPGYEGTMSFTLVNMGREPYSLVPSAGICTLLLFRFAVAPQRAYRGSNVSSKADTLRRLSPDFLQIEERARTIAKSEVQSAALGAQLWGLVVPVLVAVLAALGSGFAAWHSSQTEIAVLKAEVQSVREQLALAPVPDKLQELNSRINGIESRLPRP